MSKLIVDSPALVRLEGATQTELELARSFLSYQDSGVNYLLQQHKKRRHWKDEDPEGWQAKLLSLKAQLTNCLLFESDAADPSTYSGLAEELAQHLGGVPVERRLSYPEPKGMAWAKVPQFPPREYQNEMKAALLPAGHAAVSVGTGLGKSRVIMEICHDLALRAVVMAPSRSIAGQLFSEFARHLGSRYVGMYGDGKKQIGKLITIGIAASLTRVEPGSEAWEWFRGAQVFIADESHLTPASTLEKVCTQLMAQASYRFFFSATQMRMDGSEMVLKGITGPIVYRMSVQQGVDQGFLARPAFKMIRIRSNDSYESNDPQRMTREHLLQSRDVLDRACDIANKAHRLLGHQVLIMVDELDQFPLIQARLKPEVMFAHGQDNTADVKKKLPEAYWRSDPTELVAGFNAREFPILVGTSCISTGTDIKSVETCINLMGGKSDIAVSQLVGRCTRGGPRGVPVRRPDGTQKLACNFVDFAPMLRTKNYDDGDPDGSMSLLFRHALARAAIYKSIYPSGLTWMD